jgi:uroporphyrin-III C-methyltransferase
LALAITALLQEPSLPQSSPSAARVYLVGAGPGDPELLTLKAARLLAQADVVLYDRLIGDGVMAHCRADAERIFVGKRRARHRLPQAAINELLIERARRGQTVVRLKGGDPLIFGRAGEEIESLLAAGLTVEVVPGVTAASGCAAERLLSLTHRHHAQTLVITTGHRQDGSVDLDWPALCRPRQTLVIYMSHYTTGPICRGLVAGGLPPALPACLVESGTRPDSRHILATLATLPAIVETTAIEGPALLIVGEVLGRAGDGSVAAASASPADRAIA